LVRPTAVLKRALIFLHRWVGVVLSAIFLLWFASGIVMVYWSFPDVTAEDRLERLPTLEPERIRISVEAAATALGREQPTGQARLTSFDGRPVYRFAGGRGRGVGPMVYADDGSVAGAVDEAVVQYTTTASRFWAYLGAVPHWLYFTPLRKHQPEWFSFVVWSSLIGTITALAGVVIAIWMLSPRKRYRYAGAPTRIPYRGWKRWHTIIGLVFGVVTVTWAFSGLLSMGPFPILDRLTELTVPTPPAPAAAPGTREGRGAGRSLNLGAALRGRGDASLSAYEEKDPRAAIASIHDFDVKELEFTSFAGAPIYVATNGDGQTRIIPVRGPPRTSFDAEEVMRIVRNAAGNNLAELRVMEDYDAYYLDRRHQAPLPVVYAEMNDAARTRYYIDPKTARVVGNYSRRNWVSRWLYHGRHSLDFPWLYNYRPLWDIVVITLMLGGTALCVTSLVLTWRVLARKVAAIVRARFNSPNEDLAIEA
jgi:uncharacterized iron-regulated membrane protein